MWVAAARSPRIGIIDLRGHIMMMQKEVAACFAALGI